MHTHLAARASSGDIDERLRVRDGAYEARVRDNARGEAIIAGLPVADRVAFRYRSKDEPLDDLKQVARIGLIKAVDGFDSSRGYPFLSYAIPTITGEVKRHFRDKCWAIRPPRQLQEVVLDLRWAQAVLEQRLGAVPSVAEVAAELGTTVGQIEEALLSDACYRLDSIDRRVAGDDEVRPQPGNAALEGSDGAEARLLVGELFRHEPEQTRYIVYLRYFRDLTQSQIAEMIGVSQMQVSRILNAVLYRMKQRAHQDGVGATQ